MSRHDLPYDCEDFGLTEDELIVKYPQGHSFYTIAIWQTDDIAQANYNGYWDWAMSKLREDDDAIPSNVTEALPEPDLVPVDNLDQFVRMLVHWHQHKVKELLHYQQVPEGIEVTISSIDGSEVTHLLAGDLRKGFILGIEAALMGLGSLPFAVETATDEDEAGRQPDGSANV